jgi:penicillin amidase
MLAGLVRVINITIAVIVVLIVVAVYWYAFRPLPQESGTVRAPVRAPATILRDARGIPHIEASSWQDAIFLQGFVTAQDRLWQMDGLRRFGAGELAEVFGPAALAQDEHSRAMQMRALAERDLQFLDPQSRAVMIEYARGVNFFIDKNRGRYSLEFSLPGHDYSPRPWTVTDSILVGLVMARDMTDSSTDDFERGRILAAFNDPTRFHLLFPAVQGAQISPGSNAWAVSGTHTVDGGPLLANDPHLHYTIPGTWHLVQLKAPGLNVTGAALPGVPAVITGHNSQIAWGVTNLGADVMDLYLENIDERTGRYIFEGKAQQAQLDRQFVAVKGQKPVEFVTWVTRHGPIVLRQNGRAFSMKWSAADGFGFPFFALDEAQSWDEFQKAVKNFWIPGQNFVYADRSGNIGYQATGGIPIRKNFSGNVPLDGASGQFEWSGYIPFDQLPSFCNPTGGIIATANQNPFPPDYPYKVDGGFADKYRIDEAKSRLAAKPKFTVEDMLSIQTDVFSGYDLFLAKQLVQAYSRHGSRNDLTSQAVNVLRGWNGQMDRNEAAPVVTELLSDALRLSLISLNLRAGQQSFQPVVLPRQEIVQYILTSRPAGWVTGNDWDAWVLENAAAALGKGRDAQGSPVSKWRWGKQMQWTIAHPVGKELPLVSQFFDIGPVPMSGDPTTIKQTTETLGPSERMVVDLKDLNRSVQNLPFGESGAVASGHYRDEWDAYYAGKSFPMEFDHIVAKKTLKVEPESPAEQRR